MVLLVAEFLFIIPVKVCVDEMGTALSAADVAGEWAALKWLRGVALRKNKEQQKESGKGERNIKHKMAPIHVLLGYLP